MEKESRSDIIRSLEIYYNHETLHYRWEYRGQGIWENRDSDYEGRWSEEREPGPRLSMERERAGLGSANSSFTRKISGNTGTGGASTATAGHTERENLYFS